MTVSNETLIHILRQSPEGLTTRQIAERVGGDINMDTLSGRLAKLAAYGKIGREYRRTQKFIPQPPRYCVWKAKQDHQGEGDA